MKRQTGDLETPESKRLRAYIETESLAVTPIGRFRGALPFYRQPLEIGHFSLDDERKFYDDKRQLRCFTPPDKIDFDLRVGYKEFVKRNEDEPEGLENLLRWINCHRNKFEVIGSPRAERGCHRDKPVLAR